MAVVHISEAEAARDFHAVMSRVRAGEDLRIDSAGQVYALAMVAERPTLSEAIKRARERNPDLLLDPEFGNDVEAGIRAHEKETLIDPWEAF